MVVSVTLGFMLSTFTQTEAHKYSNHIFLKTFTLLMNAESMKPRVTDTTM